MYVHTIIVAAAVAVASVPSGVAHAERMIAPLPADPCEDCDCFEGIGGFTYCLCTYGAPLLVGCDAEGNGWHSCSGQACGFALNEIAPRIERLAQVPSRREALRGLIELNSEFLSISKDGRSVEVRDCAGVVVREVSLTL